MVAILTVELAEANGASYRSCGMMIFWGHYQHAFTGRMEATGWLDVIVTDQVGIVMRFANKKWITLSAS